ncbi:MAG: ATP-binding protein [Chthoniobacterales bacterium]|nr:ATP-binding protein [Chthoniobacterales bacterium]
MRHLNYKPWYALAEFVDNSIQSFVANRETLIDAGYSDRLKVEVFLGSESDQRIVIRDNACGISEQNYERAFKPAAAPPDRSGLSEFGMGMKSAACWFARRWKVRTAALGEAMERTVIFDIASIVEKGTEELEVVSRPVPSTAHFTEIILEDLYKAPQGRTRTKMRAHLASIYRVFLRQGWFELVVDGVPLSYESPRILVAPDYRDPSGPAIQWRREIHFDFGQGLSAHGFAALREKGSTADAGFALFRRGRLIEGSHDEGYRPEAVFGRSNSYRYQRLFGELELEGFEVSHTKDGFRWDENEVGFLELLREELNAEPLPMLDQAEEFRTLRSRDELSQGADAAAARTARAVELSAGPVVERLTASSPANTPQPDKEPPTFIHREAVIRFHGADWTVLIEATSDPAVGDCFTVTDSDRQQRRIEARIALNHPFIRRWVGTSADDIEPYMRIAAALALAEVCASLAGVSLAGTIRRNMNELLSSALSG